MTLAPFNEAAEDWEVAVEWCVFYVDPERPSPLHVGTELQETLERLTDLVACPACHVVVLRCYHPPPIVGKPSALSWPTVVLRPPEISAETQWRSQGLLKVLGSASAVIAPEPTAPLSGFVLATPS